MYNLCKHNNITKVKCRHCDTKFNIWRLGGKNPRAAKYAAFVAPCVRLYDFIYIMFLQVNLKNKLLGYQFRIYFLFGLKRCRRVFDVHVPNAYIIIVVRNPLPPDYSS